MKQYDGQLTMNSEFIMIGVHRCYEQSLQHRQMRSNLNYSSYNGQSTILTFSHSYGWSLFHVIIVVGFDALTQGFMCK